MSGNHPIIISPTVAGLHAEGTPYTGILYLGGILCEDGSIKIVEYNSRWGDPENHVILPGVKNDYYELVNKAIDGKLNEVTLEQDDLTRVCVIGASAGYPNSYEKGKRLLLNQFELPEGVEWLSAGVKLQGNDKYTAGGSGSPYVFGVLEDQYKDDLTVDEGVDIAARAMSAAMDRDSASGNGIDIAVINEKEFKMISEGEIKTRLEKFGK